MVRILAPQCGQMRRGYALSFTEILLMYLYVSGRLDVGSNVLCYWYFVAYLTSLMVKLLEKNKMAG